MIRSKQIHARFAHFFLVTPLVVACSDPAENATRDGSPGAGGSFGSGGTMATGASTGTGGDLSGTGATGAGIGGTGAAATGGMSTGGVGTGGTGGDTGGTSAGGAATGGTGGQLASCTPGAPGFEQKEGYVVDLATCVHYQVFDAVPTRLSHADATAECEGLTLGGFDDWRLPTVEELSAIVVKGVQPSVDGTLFPNTDLSMFWTSMTTGEKVTCLDFYNDGFQNDAIGPDGAQAYRCVR